MKRIAWGFFFLLSLASVAEPAAQNRLVLGGRAVIMVADAVYLFPGAGKRVLAIAGADQGLGSFLSVIDTDFGKKPVLDRNAGVETYASLKPDVVVLKTAMKKSLGAGFDALGIVQLYLNLETPEDYFTDIRNLGTLFGMEDRAEALVAFYTGKLDWLGASKRQGQAPRVLLVQASSAQEGTWDVPPASWMQTRLVEMAGGEAVWKNANPGSGWAAVNAEQIAVWNPEVILVVDYRRDSRVAAQTLASLPVLASTRAVKDGRVFGFAQDFYSWDQPDVRWILGLEWIHRLLWPDLHSSGSMQDSAREFFEFMYSIGPDSFTETIQPRLSGDFDR
ncbi:MAG: ABC transporter substrate-binding protein [Spirochaetia bacterium]|jgi:iron complex transport system substrate-binding protein|nr:ABC transporter substrate-binding protein [Spirochaetia bacterium]